MYVVLLVGIDSLGILASLAISDEVKANAVVKIEEEKTKQEREKALVEIEREKTKQAQFAGSGSSVSSQGSRKWKISDPQKKYVRQRDLVCVITGFAAKSVAHIVPAANANIGGNSPKIKTAVNGFLLDEGLETAYDEHKWVFDETGTIHVLFQHYDRRMELLKKGNVCFNEKHVHCPDKGLIRARYLLALREAAQRCPDCWEIRGESNIDNHRRTSCQKHAVLVAPLADVSVSSSSVKSNDHKKPPLTGADNSRSALLKKKKYRKGGVK